MERSYDSQNRVISERYLNRYNKLTNNNKGIAGWNGYYDAEGKLVITNCYDENRQTVEVEGMNQNAEEGADDEENVEFN